MKFSNETLTLLKNFATINPSIVFKAGSVIRTIQPQKTIMAAATVSETFDCTAAVYDLSRFLATLSLFDDPEVEFRSDRFIISGNKSKVSYTYAAENMIVSPPDKNINLPDPTAVFDVQWKDLDSVVRAASILRLPEIAFVSDGTSISIESVDARNSTSDTYKVTIADDIEVPEFKMYIKVDNIKLLPNDYTVSLSSKGLAHFKASNVDYWIALDAK